MMAGGPPTRPPGDWHLDVEQAAQGTHQSHEAPVDAPRVPPTPEQLVEAMLFVGGHPLTAAVACAAVRGLTPERFLIAIDASTRPYRRQRRPYAIQARDAGFVLAVLPSFRRFANDFSAAHASPAEPARARRPFGGRLPAAGRESGGGRDPRHGLRRVPSSTGAARPGRGAAPRRGRKLRGPLRHHPAFSPALQPRVARRTAPPWATRRRCRTCHTPRRSG